MFIDEAVIRVRAGNGGNGAISFRREKYVPKGGPDGGDGGAGGDIYLVANPNIRTLLRFRHQTIFRAGHGEPGRGKQMFGADGEDLLIPVPVGTQVQEAGGNRPVADMVLAGQKVRIADGGRGGKGNVHFKSPTRRTPRIATDGTEGEEWELRLTLKLLADVGLVGLPNVGKSTLLSRLSNATPRIGDYPFTTLRPNLGIVPLGEYDSFVLADLPGLVEGAHAGRGLGLRFLRHVERTRLLLFVIDAAAADPAADLATLREELASFSPALVRRPSLVAYSRIDLVGGRDLPALDGVDPLRFSAHTGEGVGVLLRRLQRQLEEILSTEASLAESGVAGLPSPGVGRSDGARGVEEAQGDTASPTRAFDAVEAGAVDDGVGFDGATTETLPLEGTGTGTSEADPVPSAGEFADRAFADRVDAREPLGDMPWPRSWYAEESA